MYNNQIQQGICFRDNSWLVEYLTNPKTIHFEAVFCYLPVWIEDIPILDAKFEEFQGKKVKFNVLDIESKKYAKILFNE
jgi:hypothetical protein